MLKIELVVFVYCDDGQGKELVIYVVNGGCFVIFSCGYNDVDGWVVLCWVELLLVDGGVVLLCDVDSCKVLKVVWLDLVCIVMLYGQKQEECCLICMDEVLDLLVIGLQVVEDKDFNCYYGIDLFGIVCVVWVMICFGGQSCQGVLMFIQQLVCSGLFGIGKEQMFICKFNEVLYVLIMEVCYDKCIIFEVYFNQVYLGQCGSQVIYGMFFGVEFWFGCDLQLLEIEQIVLLIGLVKGLFFYDSWCNLECVLDCCNFVLGKLYEVMLIDDVEYQCVLKVLLGVFKILGLVVVNCFFVYVDLVCWQFVYDYLEFVLQGVGLSVMIGMLLFVQVYVEGVVICIIKLLESQCCFELQVGMVLIDVYNGDVLVVIGSCEVFEVGFNCVIEVQCLVGLLFKLFVYLLVLVQFDCYLLVSWVDDLLVMVQFGRGCNWSFGNVDNCSYGMVCLIDVLVYLYNQVMVCLGMQVGFECVIQLIYVLVGIKVEVNLVVIFGLIDQSLYVMVQLYQFFVFGGEIQLLYVVCGVFDLQGKLFKCYDKMLVLVQEGDLIVVNLISVGLQQVVVSGIVQWFNVDGFGCLQLVGKIGIINDGCDSWYVGYIGDYLVVIWIGNDQNQQVGLYGVIGVMWVWLGIFQCLLSVLLWVSNKGLDWQLVVFIGFNSIDEGCFGVCCFLFVVGYVFVYVLCVLVVLFEGQGEVEGEGGGW